MVGKSLKNNGEKMCETPQISFREQNLDELYKI